MALRFALLVLLCLAIPDWSDARPVSLDEVLSRARSLRGAESRADVAEASALVGASTPAIAPRLLVSHTESPPRKHVSLEENLGNMMSRSDERSALNSELARARADSLRSALDLERLARLAFFHALAARESLRLAQDEVSLADSLADAAAKRHQAGDISELEKDQATLEALRVRQDLAPAEGDVRAAIAMLAATIAWTEADPPEPAGNLADALDLPFSPEPEVTHLPELRGALADSAASEYHLKAARRARIPWPDLEVGVEWDDPAEGERAQSVIGLAFTLGWGQASGFADAAEARAARDASRAGAMRYEAVRLIAEVRARRDAAATRARQERDLVVPLARRIRARAVRSYQAGETGLVSALEAIRSERAAALSFVADLTAFQEARADWDALVGSAP